MWFDDRQVPAEGGTPIYVALLRELDAAPGSMAQEQDPLASVTVQHSKERRGEATESKASENLA
jgi:hypothetical protein